MDGSYKQWASALCTFFRLFFGESLISRADLQSFQSKELHSEWKDEVFDEDEETKTRMILRIFLFLLATVQAKVCELRDSSSFLSLRASASG
jgi:hypothetical protein